MSKAWYKPSALPRLVAKFRAAAPSPILDPTPSDVRHLRRPPPPVAAAADGAPTLNAAAGFFDRNDNDHTDTRRRHRPRSVEVWTTTCIVTNFGMQRGKRRNDDNVDGNGDGNDAVTPPPLLPRCSTLINPANPDLSGPAKFPYFPVGGPVPPGPPEKPAHHIMGYVTQWGGMDVGRGMVFSSAVIDGLIHQLGGSYLRAEIALLSSSAGTSRFKCPTGTAVVTSAGSGSSTDVGDPGASTLSAEYDRIVHTAPPFYDFPPDDCVEEELDRGSESGAHGERKSHGRGGGVKEEGVEHGRHHRSVTLLHSCFRESLKLAFDNQTNDGTTCQPLGTFLGNLLLQTPGFAALSTLAPAIFSAVSSAISPPPPPPAENGRVAFPLLGAGCRGFPVDVALDVAALESAVWLLDSTMTTTSAVAVGTTMEMVETTISEEEEGITFLEQSAEDVEREKRERNTLDAEEDCMSEEEEGLVVAFGLLEEKDANLLVEKIRQELALGGRRRQV